MKCSKCGTFLIEGEKYCRGCGNLVDAQVNDQETGNKNQTNITEEYLVKAYIGKNHDKFKEGNFSTPFFFFGSIYALYRKMYLLAFSLIALSIALLLFLPGISEYILVFLNIYFAATFNTMYLKKAREEVQKIKSSNLGISNEKLMLLCSGKGGVNVLGMIAVLLVQTVVVIIILFPFFEEGFREAIEEGRARYDERTNQEAREIVFKDLSVYIPSYFEQNEHSAEDYLSYHYITAYDSCIFQIGTVYRPYYDAAEKYLDENRFMFAENVSVSNIENKEINNEDWKFIYVESDSTYEYYYAIDRQSTVYYLYYSFLYDKSENCLKAYDELIESLKFE